MIDTQLREPVATAFGGGLDECGIPLAEHPAGRRRLREVLAGRGR